MSKEFIAGGLGGTSGILVAYPLDTVKVLIQTQTPDNRKYFTTPQALVRVVREDGVLRLYRGMMGPLCTTAITNAVLFGVYGWAKENLGEGTLWDTARNGFLAGLARAVVISPIEVIKTQQQVGKGLGLKEAWGRVYRNAGLFGLTRGYTLTFMREPLSFLTYFSVYEALTKGRESNPFLPFLAGGIAGICSWIPTYPQDVIKSRIQGDGWGKDRVFKGNIDCVKKSLAAEGYVWMWRGFGSTAYRAFVINAVVLGVQQTVSRAWKDD